MTGPAIELTTTNISCGGASLLDDKPCDAAYLAIDLSGAGFGVIQALLEVLRVRRLMSAYVIAGRWHCRVNPFSFQLPMR